jgi:hypothetical protein
VQRRCVSLVQFRNSGCRPRHGLHGQEQIPAQPRLPRVLQTRARGRGHPGRRGEASQHQAGSCAQASQRQVAKAQEAGEATRNLTAMRACMLSWICPGMTRRGATVPPLAFLVGKPRAAGRTRFVRPRPAVDSVKTSSRFDFCLCCNAWCDSKANRAEKSGASPQLALNFSFTNQPADSFSSSGVNLEAKV